MPGVYDGAVQELIDELGRLPGIGPKSAQRIAFHILEQEPADVAALTNAISRVKDRVHFCEVCGNVTESQICSICSDARRIDTVICVVEEAKDIVAIERTREYRGRYHVLGGSINPIQGVGPDPRGGGQERLPGRPQVERRQPVGRPELPPGALPPAWRRAIQHRRDLPQP